MELEEEAVRNTTVWTGDIQTKPTSFAHSEEKISAVYSSLTPFFFFLSKLETPFSQSIICQTDQEMKATVLTTINAS